MKKQLPTSVIANELTGASVFFQPSPTTPLVLPPIEPARPTDFTPPSSHTPSMESATVKAPQQTEHLPAEQQTHQPMTDELFTPKQNATMPPRYHDTKQPPTPALMPANSHAAEPPRHQATVTPPQLEAVRKAVKQLGKEAATHRFTVEEKQALAAVVYAYARRGCKTSENELTRIAINWLLLDYQAQGEQSILAQVVRALNE